MSMMRTAVRRRRQARLKRMNKRERRSMSARRGIKS